VDADAFAAEAADLHTRLVRVVSLVAGDRALAEECAQEALLRAWERVERGAPLDSLVAWTTTVALNACRSSLRRRRAEARALDRLPGRADAAEPAAEGLTAEVRDAVRALPLRQREVVVLHYLLDQDVATVARHAGITPGAVKNALFHARAALAARLRVDASTAAEPATTPLSEDYP